MATPKISAEKLRDVHMTVPMNETELRKVDRAARLAGLPRATFVRSKILALIDGEAGR